MSSFRSPSSSPSPAVELLELGDALLELDRDWRIVRVNRKQEELSGKPRSETLGRVLWELWPDTADPKTLYWLEYHRCMEQRVAVQFDAYYAPLALWTAVTAHPIGTGGIAVFFRDVTASKRAEQERRESEARLRLALDAARMVAWEYDPVTLAVTFSDNAEAVLALPRRHENSDQGYGLIHPDDVARHRALVTGALESGGSYVSAYRHGHDGDPIWLEEHGRAVLDDRGRTVRLVGVVQNVTERRHAEDALRESKDRLHSVMENMAEGLVMFDANGDITYQNLASERIHAGRLAGEERRLERLSVTWSVRRYPEGDVVPPAQWAIPRVLRGERVHGERFFVDCHEDPARSFVGIYSGCPVYDAQGRLAYGFLTIEDITEQARAEEALREANRKLQEAGRRKDEFLAMLSHELRNPLAAISNVSAILNRDPAQPPPQRALHEMLQRQTRHLARMVDDLLDVARMTRGQIQIRKDFVRLDDLARQAGADVEPLMAARAHRLSVRTAEEIWVEGDEARLKQVLSNLLENAAKYTDSGGAIALETGRHGGEAFIRVSDNGRGIDAALLSEVFDLFTQGPRTIDRSEGGLGIGLALVKRLAEMHGGRVEVTSDPGVRTAFTVRLPLASNPPAVRDRHAARPSVSGLRILIVEDNTDAADSLATLLRMAGNDAQLAYDGAQGLEKARRWLPDAIVLDIGLPTMNGHEVCRTIRDEPWGKDVPIFAVTGWGQADDYRKSTEAGFDGHFVKPVNPQAVLTLLATLLPRRGARANLE